MTSSFLQPQNETVPQAADRVPPSIRRFGAGLVEQARLRAKFAAVLAVAGSAAAVSTAALAKSPGDKTAPLPSARRSLYFVQDPIKNPAGIQITPDTDLSRLIDPLVKCDSCRVELRCPGGELEGIVFQERMDDGGLYAPVDKMRGRAVLASCPGDKKPAHFVVPQLMPLVPLIPQPAPPPAAPPTEEAAQSAVPPAPPPKPEPLPIPPAPIVQPSAAAGDTVAAVAAESAAEKSSEAKPVPETSPHFAFDTGIEVPLVSTHGFMRDSGVFVQGVGRPLKALAGARGVVRAAWNPIAEQPAGDDARFHPRNPTQRLNGNMMRATAGLTYPYEVAKSGGFSLDAEGGVDAGLAVLSVPRRRDVGVDQDGYLADIPGSDAVTAVVEGHGGLTAHFGERLRVALGLRYGQSPFAVQTKAGARERAHANFTSVNAGLGVQF